MSKSRGNIIDPMDRLVRYSTDGLRYFLLARGVPQNDGSKNVSLNCKALYFLRGHENIKIMFLWE